MNLEECCTLLRPLFGIGVARDLNGPSGYRLAELIRDRGVAVGDLTVSEIQELLEQVSREANA